MARSVSANRVCRTNVVQMGAQLGVADVGRVPRPGGRHRSWSYTSGSKSRAEPISDLGIATRKSCQLHALAGNRCGSVDWLTYWLMTGT